MSYRDGQKYRGVISHVEWIESQKGTPGLQVDIENDEEGPITHVFYVTETHA